MGCWFGGSRWEEGEDSGFGRDWKDGPLPTSMEEVDTLVFCL